LFAWDQWGYDSALDGDVELVVGEIRERSWHAGEESVRERLLLNLDLSSVPDSSMELPLTTGP
jgi:hypothetical protein